MTSIRQRLPLKPVVLAVLAALMSPAAHPVARDWTNPAGGSWATPGNWSGAAVPLNGDDATINLP